ncbi:extracellular solute-binding protein [Nitratireductor sp. ZSWI3]|uniref:extracellular solute-binding protein n=1 Tax=Nitratireductor sp. ZSWI3 TaxID=2966359 RepID=UPI00214FB446|nr:extracellular solute-binding protein [Nitratireductor sp. ZSWI3]MCR4268309.1 extracellular solute-binding protein [Nitratireductor sp. ZSWI3]
MLNTRNFAAMTAVVSTLLTGSFPTLAEAATRIEWWYGNGGRIEVAIQEMIANFNASQDDYEVVGVRKGDYEETFAAMIAAYRAGQHPAIIQATERSVLTMLNSNAIVPVAKLAEEHGHSMNKDDFLAPVASYYVVGDELNALPFNSSTGIMWYNADHFAKAGFEAPAQTWDAFEKQLYAIKDQGISECAMVLNTDFVWSMVEGFSAINDLPFGTRANGRDGLDAEYVYNTTRTVEQVERLNKWVDDGIIQLSGQGMSPGQLFTSGTCSTWSASTAAHAQVEAEAKFDWSASLQPHLAGVEPKNSNLGGAALWVLQGKTDEEYAAAAAFLDFVARPQTQAWWSETTGYIPVTNAAYELMAAEGFFQKHPTREIALLQLTRGEPSDNSWGFRFGNSNQWWAVINEELQAAFSGKKSVQEALDSSVERGNKILRQYEQINVGN